MKPFELEVVERAASEYAGRGYTVIVQPTPVQLPDFLKEFRPDLLALSSSDNVVIEVKARQDLRDRLMLRLSEVVAKHRGWRFELIVANPPVGEEIPPDADLVRLPDVQAWLKQARDSASLGLVEASTLIAWSAAEAVLRLLVEDDIGEPSRRGSSYLLKQAYSLGLIGREEYDYLSEFILIRNAVAHGFASEDLNVSRVLRLIEIVDEIQGRERPSGTGSKSTPNGEV